MNRATAESALAAVRLVRTESGRLVQWHLYDYGNGYGSLVYADATGKQSATGQWGELISVLRASNPCDGAEVA